MTDQRRRPPGLLPALPGRRASIPAQEYAMHKTPSSIPTITLNDGTGIPQLGFGTLAVQPDRESTPSNIETTAKTVSQALQAGYRHIDTAQAYGTERGVGHAIAAS